MSACTTGSAVQLLAAAFTFLLTLLCFEMLWVNVAEDLHDGDIAIVLRKRSWLNAFVAFNAVGATILLLYWVDACTSAS